LTDLTGARHRIATYVAMLAGRPVGDGEPLISSQLLESIAAVQLLEYIEQSYDVVIDDDELILANFDSVDALVALVRTKVGDP
jgi:methoxymalonate biosynthesis acyl carrier protein